MESDVQEEGRVQWYCGTVLVDQHVLGASKSFDITALLLMDAVFSNLLVS